MATLGDVSGDNLRMPNLLLMFFYVWHREQFVPGVPALAGFQLRQEDCDLKNIDFKASHNMRQIVLGWRGIETRGIKTSGI